MTAELKMGAKIEAPQPIETMPGAPNERPELKLEKPETTTEKVAEPTPAAVVPVKPIPSVISAYEEREKQIENFLARDLAEIYLSLPAEKKAEFRRSGEETARQINKLMEKTKINIVKIVSLIRKWLSLIPGVNKFFLEQEAKIKADEIIKLKRDI